MIILCDKITFAKPISTPTQNIAIAIFWNGFKIGVGLWLSFITRHIAIDPAIYFAKIYMAMASLQERLIRPRPSQDLPIVIVISRQFVIIYYMAKYMQGSAPAQIFTRKTWAGLTRYYGMV